MSRLKRNEIFKVKPTRKWCSAYHVGWLESNQVQMYGVVETLRMGRHIVRTRSALELRRRRRCTKKARIHLYKCQSRQLKLGVLVYSDEIYRYVKKWITALTLRRFYLGSAPVVVDVI